MSKPVWIAGATVAILAVASSAIIIVRHPFTPHAAHYFTQAQLTQANFDIYTPTQLPPGFSARNNSATTPKEDSHIYIIDFQDKHGHHLYLSQQARITTFDYGGFYNKVVGGKTVTSSLGQLVAGYTDSSHASSIASLVTPKTWLIANGNGISPSDLRDVLVHLERVR